MNRFVLALAACALIVSAKAFAQTPAPSPDATPTPSPFEYSDPAMSFKAPEGFLRLPLAPRDPAKFDQQTLMAAWVRDPGKPEQLTITITMEEHDKALDGFEMISENELRNKVDSVFFKKPQLTQLKNGMPAFWQELTLGSGFDTLKRFDYVWIDGVRGVILAVTGKYGHIDEPTAKQILADAYGVQYPKYRL